jgi:c(7)-type cytochrome triheme protein
MKKQNLLLVLLSLLCLSTTGFAVPPGQKVEFTDNSMGTVTFWGDKHQKYKCQVCHATLFKMQKGSSKIGFEHHQGAKRFCFFCHNSGASFSALENCNKCHEKK